MDWKELKQNFGDFVHGYFVSEYERKLREQFVALNDLFMLQCFMDLRGLPHSAPTGSRTSPLGACCSASWSLSVCRIPPRSTCSTSIPFSSRSSIRGTVAW